MGLEGIAEDSSPSESFLCQVADTFFHALTDLPELELARENAEVLLSEEAAEKLLQAVPFVMGSEYVSKEWIENIFHKLRGIYVKEITTYDGTVKMYLTERSQKLRVPERVFFHLVENKDSEFPFAFLATYATKDEDGRVQHVPLKYALTEYHNEREKLLTLAGLSESCCRDIRINRRLYGKRRIVSSSSPYSRRSLHIFNAD